MDNKPQRKYNRVLLKLSGEALMGELDFGLSVDVLTKTATEIKQLASLGVEIAIVIGGGNYLRGGNIAKSGMNRVVADKMGMLATVMNSLALQDSLNQQNVATLTMSSIELPGISHKFNHEEAIKAMHSAKKVCIFAGGTGNPFFTTDTAACLRGIEIDADVVIKATKVDGVYDKDPVKFKDAKKYDSLSYDDVLEQKLEVMDLIAIHLCQQHKMPLRVINMTASGSLLAMMQSDAIGTSIRE